MHVASARGAPPPERERAVARSRVRTRELCLLVAGRGCNGGFGRDASENGGFRGNKACYVDFDPYKIKILNLGNFSKILF